MATAFALGAIETAEGERAALVVDGAFYRLDALTDALAPVSLRALMEDWGALMRIAAPLADEIRARGGQRALVDAPTVLAPLRYPDKLLCVGANYRDHLEQMGLPAARWPVMPFFLRPPTTSIVGPGRTIRIPAMTQKFDWEIELAVVLGRALRNASEAEARDAIAGYTVGIDFTCRDLIGRDLPAGPDIIRAKAQDTMGPIGPVLAPAVFVGDPQDLFLRLWVNDVLRQDGHTSNMLFSVPEQISIISQFISLAPGDVVFTGSPAGSAKTPDQFLKPGDRVRAEIEKVGTLELELYQDPAT